MPSEFSAVIVAVPSPFAVTLPHSSTVATDSGSAVQESTRLLTDSEKTPSTLRLSPTSISQFSGTTSLRVCSASPPQIAAALIQGVSTSRQARSNEMTFFIKFLLLFQYICIISPRGAAVNELCMNFCKFMNKFTHENPTFVTIQENRTESPMEFRVF